MSMASRVCRVHPAPFRCSNLAALTDQPYRRVLHRHFRTLAAGAWLPLADRSVWVVRYSANCNHHNYNDTPLICRLPSSISTFTVSVGNVTLIIQLFKEGSSLFFSSFSSKHHTNKMSDESGASAGLLRDILQQFTDNPKVIIGAAAVGLLAFFVVDTLRAWYRLCHVPGPFGAGLTRLWMFRGSMRAQQPMEIQAAIEKYGRDNNPLQIDFWRILSSCRIFGAHWTQ